MTVSENYLEKEKVYYFRFRKVAGVDDIKAALARYLIFPKRNQVTGLLIDFRKCRFNFNDEGAREIAEFIGNIPDIDASKKISFMVDTPKETAIIDIFSTFKEDHKMKYKFFSTIEAVLNYLEISDKSKSSELVRVLTNQVIQKV